MNKKEIEKTLKNIQSKEIKKFIEDWKTVNSAKFTCDAEDVLEVLNNMKFSEKDKQLEKLLLKHCKRTEDTTQEEEIEM